MRLLQIASEQSMRYNMGMLINRPLSRNIILAIGIALIIVIALVAAARYFIVRDKRAEQKPPAQSVSVPAPIPDDILRSLTPPAGAKPVEISQETLDSLTPPKDAQPIEISQSVLDSLTPPAGE